MKKLALLILPVIFIGCSKIGLEVPKTAVNVKHKDGKTCLVVSVETCMNDAKFKESMLDKCPVKVDY